MVDTANLYPTFSTKLDAFRKALTEAGIGNSVVSGYRSKEYQNQMYQNHLAKQAGQPLPYPKVEAPGVVAPPGRSFHNYGIAADFHLTNPNDYARMAAMAPQYGLSGIGASDPGHIQLAGSLDQDIEQYNLANWGPGSQPVVADAGTTVNSVPAGVHSPHTLTPATAGAPYTPEAVAAANPPPAVPPPPTFGESIAKGDVGSALRAALTKPPAKDGVEQKSPLEKVGDAISSQGQQKQAPAVPEQQQAMAVQDPDPGLAPAAQQLYSTVAAAAAKPLTWTSTPYGSNAGLQRPLGPMGTTLNATGYGYG